MKENTCSTREAAAALGICVRTVQLWVEQGRLKAWKTPGGHRRIFRESIGEQLREREKSIGGGADDFDILIVEDDQIFRQMVQSKLRSVTPMINIRTANNGIEGLIKLGERNPQILITDLLMPGLDGFHMLNTLTSSPSFRPMQIFVMTGMSDDEIFRQGGVPEGVVVFHKPIEIAVLVSLVRAYYDGWRLQKKNMGATNA